MNTYELTWTGRDDALALASTGPDSSITHIGPLHTEPLEQPGKARDGGEPGGETPAPPGTTSHAALPAHGSMVIEGDNLDALKHLQATHAGRVAVTYIDPPYNTGNALPYRDSFGASGHAGWMSMMLPRLMLARDLMRDDGVIFVSIDDRELAFLTLVGHQVFGEGNFLGSFAHQRAKGGGQARTWIRGHDYIAVWAKNSNHVGGFVQEKRPPAKYRTIDGARYLVEDDVLRATFGKYERGTERRLMYEDIAQVRGQSKKAEVDAWLASGTHTLVPWSGGKHAVARITPAREATSKMYSIIRALGHEGRDDLEKLGLGGMFDYPKPVSLLRTLVQSRTYFEPEAVVLDFFAGSGTTAQAVLDLNASDGGRREFILVQTPEPLRGRGDSTDPVTISRFARQRVRAAALANGVDPQAIFDVRLEHHFPRRAKPTRATLEP